MNGDSPPRFDAVVVGSGFGGSIAAHRMAEAGHSVMVLERGRHYRPGQFPRDVTDIDALFWRQRRRKQATGLYDLRFFSGGGCVVAAGVGGGSLVYAGVNVRPVQKVFDDPRWPAGTSRHSLDPYYDRVAKMLEVAPLPVGERVPKREVFRYAGEQMGRPVVDPDESVRWPARTALLASPRRQPCVYCAECEFGCQVGAKHTADSTYLAEARARGAVVRPGRVVVGLRAVTDGYAVTHRDVVTGTQEVTVARRVVLAAGTLGTTELLLRCRDVDKTLPLLSHALGQGFSANGDFLGSIHRADVDLSPNFGPDVTSVMHFFDQAPEFTLAAPTFNEAVMKALANLGQPSARILRPFAPLLWRLLPWAVPQMFAHGLLSRPLKYLAPGRLDWRRSTNLFGIGRDNANGRLHLTTRGLDMTWDYGTENAELIERQQQAMHSLTDYYGGTFAPLIFWNAFRRTVTVHPLGGCRMSDSPTTGVVNAAGEVHSYPGLFIADGSVVPASIGFHPAMTISALAERTCDAALATM
ncbi:GMC oxidoreductase [Mycolicibacterium arseniciresistens]|uniref:Cholesterol oxidase n=1 Tax=Mycolicibacterium arseniciresistens TaxID=3062257 RepID=A0ABT8UCU3_9MYCO|nr:GMC family oxidoreductase [Mycolicibacterium arseniciresistens]MDO3634620.1 GMC family oxidoreductase [Mycolicibacterium arseniciresistens]